MRLSAIKKLCFEAYLSTGMLVGVQVDATRCILPPFFAGVKVLLMEYGLNTPVAIPDLRSDVAGITATLSFGRRPFHTSVPWEAVVLVGLRESGQWLQLVVFRDFLDGDQPPATMEPTVRNDGARELETTVQEDTANPPPTNVIPFRRRDT